MKYFDGFKIVIEVICILNGFLISPNIVEIYCWNTLSLFTPMQNRIWLCVLYMKLRGPKLEKYREKMKTEAILLNIISPHFPTKLLRMFSASTETNDKIQTIGNG